MKAKITYISKSNKSAILMINQQLGPIVQMTSGFVRLPEGHEYSVDDELDIPASKVRKEVRATDDGQAFDFLVFE